MALQKVTIIDTGCANLSSVRFALNRLQVEATVSADRNVILNSDKLILPGVGTAVAAMQNLEERHIPEILASCDIPLLGICLGMQMLAESSTETMSSGGSSLACLQLVKGKVLQLQSGDLPLPHMGWNQVQHDGTCPLFKDIPSGSYFYFVHSYALEITSDTVATSNYGQYFNAVVNSKNFYGTQFHPEKSGRVGAKLLQNFLDM